MLELDKIYDISRIVISFENHINPTLVEASVDGSTWNTVMTIDGGGNEVKTYDDISLTAKYLRLSRKVTGAGNEYFSIYEIEVYGVESTTAPTIEIVDTKDAKAACKHVSDDDIRASVTGKNVSLYAWGWLALTADYETFGYRIDDNAPVFNDAWIHPAEGPVMDAVKSVGGTVGTRFKIDATVEDVAVGQHTVQYLYKLKDGTIVCFAAKEFEVKEATSTEPKKEYQAPINNGKLDAYHENGWGAAGYNCSVAIIGYNGYIDLGELDLAKYSKVIIMYGSDGSAASKAHYEANAAAHVIGLKTVTTAYGFAGNELNLEGDVAHVALVFSDASWNAGQRAAEIDLTGVDTKGHIYLSVHNPQEVQIAVTSIVFVEADDQPMSAADIFDLELTDTWKDISAKKNELTTEGTPKIVDRDGAKALDFDGTGSSYVKVSNADSLYDTIKTGFTFELDVELKAIAESSIVSNMQAGGYGFEIIGNKMYFNMHCDGSYVGPSFTPDANVRYHLAVTYNGNELTLYVNGKKVDSVVVGNNIRFAEEGSNVLVIGGDSDEQSGSLPCSAYIYGVRIYSAVASAAQVVDLYNANK
ncbi:putative phosphohydrolases Icc family [Clostridium sp. CAG:448]|nr:putative phosphohydrolases Icc family [Clostridium sp. CAG:448]